RKLRMEEADVIAIVGETSSLVAAVVISLEKAVLGALLGLVVDVTQLASVPVCVVVQPAGRAGATTLSKFSANPMTACPTNKVKLRVTGPRLLLMLTGIVRRVPHGVPGGIV